MKEIDWSFIHGEGDIVCYCDYDNCGNEHNYPFDDGYPNFKACQEELKDMGWLSKYIDGNWYDFCCEKCYYAWIKKHK